VGMAKKNWLKMIEVEMQEMLGTKSQHVKSERERCSDARRWINGELR